MPTFPVIERVTIENYGLYPGSIKEPFVLDFKSGVTTIAGVNGSGKTTLIHLLKRVLTGPFDLPEGRSDDDLGQLRARIRPLSSSEKATFANRVADGAVEARISAVVRVGDTRISLERSLANLALLSMTIDDTLSQSGSAELEEKYQSAFIDAMEVGTFFDAIVLIDLLLFFSEERRPLLVWDPTAQRQIWRILALPPKRAKSFSDKQQELISADSAYRNTYNVRTRLQKNRDDIATTAQKITDIEGELRLKRRELNDLRKQEEELTQDRLDGDREKKDARLEKLKAEQAYEGALRELEHLKLEVLGDWFRPTQQSTKYIYANLLAEGRCLVCEADPAPNLGEIQKRMNKGLCPVCGSKHVDPGTTTSKAPSERIEQLESELQIANDQMREKENRLKEAIDAYDQADKKLDDIRSRGLALERQMIGLMRRLPADRQLYTTTSGEIDNIERQLQEDEESRNRASRSFSRILKEITKSVEDIQEGVAYSFSKYIRLFLREEASLIYQSVSQKVAQGVKSFDFPALVVTMTGGATVGTVLRRASDTVSQSQREFIDLAFRMAILEALSASDASMLVVDAPEASLDFLFAERAGDQLAAFAHASNDNKVIVTSYLPSHYFVSSVLKRYKTRHERRERIVNLIEDAAPNAATREDKEKYQEFLQKVIDGEIEQ